MCPSVNLTVDFDSFLDDVDSFSFHPITEYELIQSFNSIKSNQIIYQSTSLNNISFFCYWKLEKIIPILKNFHDGTRNYRPISILFSVSKILKNVMKEILYL